MSKSRVKLFLLILAFFVAFFCSQKVLSAGFGGLEQTAGTAKLKSVTSVQTLIGNILGAGLSLISVIFFALMLYAGIRWMTARGNEEAEKKAKDTILGGAIGMIIIMASYGLTNLVFNAATKGGTLSGSGVGAGGKTVTTKAGKPVTDVSAKWCFTKENTCVLLPLPSSVCSGTIYPTEIACNSLPDLGKPKETPVPVTPPMVKFCVLSETVPGNYVCHEDNLGLSCKDISRYIKISDCEDYAQTEYGLKKYEFCTSNLQCNTNYCLDFQEACNICGNNQNDQEVCGAELADKCLKVTYSGNKVCY